MAVTTKTLLNSSDRLLGMSDNGRLISYVETVGTDQTLFVLDVNTNQTFPIDTFTIGTTPEGTSHHRPESTAASSPRTADIFYTAPV